VHVVSHEHSFTSSSALVEEGGVRHIHSSEFSDHGLEVEQAFKSSLSNFSLIWGIGSIPSGILKNVSVDYSRHGGRVVALT